MRRSKDDIVQNLADAGCDAKAIKEILSDLEEKKFAKGIQRLTIHRKKLLDTIHETQRCIDCLDYLEYEIKKEQRDEIDK